MGRGRWRRKRVWVPALVLLLVGAALTAILVPSIPALRFLRRLGEGEPTPEWAGRYLRRFSDLHVSTRGPSPLLEEPRFRLDRAGAPALVVAHGLTDQGVADPRLWRMAASLEAAGFGVRIPEIRDFVRLEGATAQSSPGQVLADVGPRTGIVAISVGGGVALRAAARAFREKRPDVPRALLLVGTPDDVALAARDWFRRPDAPDDAPAPAREPAESGRFARLAIYRVALERLVPEPERKAIGAWLLDAPVWRLKPFPPGAALGADAKRFVDAASAGERVSDVDRDWLLAAVDDFLGAISPARFDDELDALRCPVFLIHGVTDPLVPVEQMDRLRARLARRVPVEALASPMLSHVAVEEPGLREKWRHVRFIQRFFDVVSDAPDLSDR